MGQVFGRTGVAEPAYEVLHRHTENFAYEVRKYGKRYAAEASYAGKDDTPFMVLARYIGVFGSPENEGKETIAMTAPVVKESKKGGGGTAIAMTAPVVKKAEGGGADGEKKVMEFILPTEYDSISKIPKPTNPDVRIKEIPPAVGVVHQYSGSMEDEKARAMAKLLAHELQKNGLPSMTEEYVLDQYQFWGYNPPFTLPMFRRNEIWVGIDEQQANVLINGVTAHEAN